MNTNLRMFHLMHLSEIRKSLDYAPAESDLNIDVAVHEQRRRPRDERIKHEQRSRQNLALGHFNFTGKVEKY
jgi:hypothetical protein